MSEEIFTKAIRANMDDDLPRLVYADWLEEQGQAARAEFIRVQCELEYTPEQDPRYRILEDREHELLSRHEREFLGPNWPELHRWPNGPSEWIWKRGFIDEVSINFGNLQTAGYLSDHPIRSLNLSSDFGQPLELLDCRELWPMLEGLRGIDFSGWQNLEHDPLKRFFNSDHLPNLTDLDFSTVTHHWDACEILKHCPELCRRLRRLGTDGTAQEPTIGSPFPNGPVDHSLAVTTEQAVIDQMQAGLEELSQVNIPDFGHELMTRWLQAGQPHRNLKLDLDNNFRIDQLRLLNSGDSKLSVREFAMSRLPMFFVQHRELRIFLSSAFHRLEAFRLSSSELPTDSASRLQACPFWHQSLQRLSLNAVFLRDGVGDMLFYPHPPKVLRQLDLSGTAVPDSTVRAMTSGPLAGQLTHLRLYDCELTDASLEAFRAARDWPSLRLLNLGRNRFSEEQINGLVASINAPQLRQISLAHTQTQDPQVLQLVERHQLSGLGLRRTGIFASLLYRLANSPKLRRLNWLDLSMNNQRFNEDALVFLAESPYLSPVCEVILRHSITTPRVREAFESRLGPRVTI